MKKNRFVGRWATFFLTVALFSITLISCNESSEDLVKPKTMTDIIWENDQFSILRDIVIRAEMMDALRTENITFFAPDNNAFGKANIFSSSSFTSLTPDSAKSFLQNHMVKNKMVWSDLKPGKKTALNKASLNITKIDSIVAINKADIVIPDVSADNGVMHVIDSLIVR